MKPHRIETLDDPRVAVYRNLRDFELRRKQGLFLAEGRENVRCLIERSPLFPDSVFVTDSALEGLRNTLEGLATSVPIFVAEPRVLDAVAGFHLHRGALAAGRAGESPAFEDVLPADSAPSRIVVVEQVAAADNLGAIFRNAQAFGADAVLLGPRSADPLYRKAIRVSMGATLCLPHAQIAPWPGALDRLRDRGYAILALHPDPRAPGSRSLDDLDPAALRRCALVLGAEGTGISAPALHRVDTPVRIGMAPGVDSINVAAASAIALHALGVSR